jgi:hypothetical protein
MFLLVTGASGVGKTTVRTLLQPQLTPEVECLELRHLSANPGPHSLEWRQRTTELAVQRTVQLQREGRHLLLWGDPVAAVEVAAAPSAAHLDGLAVCLLDAQPEAQAERLTSRGDPAALLPHHHAFAAWMRGQAADPRHMLEVVTTGGWAAMAWAHLPALTVSWRVTTIDTTNLAPTEVAGEVKVWIDAVLDGHEAVINLRRP